MSVFIYKSQGWGLTQRSTNALFNQMLPICRYAVALVSLLASGIIFYHFFQNSNCPLLPPLR